MLGRGVLPEGFFTLLLTLDLLGFLGATLLASLTAALVEQMVFVTWTVAVEMPLVAAPPEVVVVLTVEMAEKVVVLLGTTVTEVPVRVEEMVTVSMPDVEVTVVEATAILENRSMYVPSARRTTL